MKAKTIAKRLLWAFLWVSTVALWGGVTLIWATESSPLSSWSVCVSWSKSGEWVAPDNQPKGQVKIGQ